MLVGYRKGETIEEVLYRFNAMREMGIATYPMVYDPHNKELKKFQRWAIRKYFEVVPFNEFNNSFRNEKLQAEELF